MGNLSGSFRWGGTGVHYHTKVIFDQYCHSVNKEPENQPKALAARV